MPIYQIDKIDKFYSIYVLYMEETDLSQTFFTRYLLSF